MRILQLIDSLEAGGAERMAVNYANALQREFSFSALCVTRKEGILQESLLPQIGYLFLNKKNAIDFKAVLKLRNFIKEKDIEFIHAHSTSFFTAVLLKIIYPKIKIVWHDHYGNSEFLSERKTSILKLASLFFYGIISVNQQLKNWAQKELAFNKVIYMPNFTTTETSLKEDTILKGKAGNQILCLANLREQKGHFFLLEIALKIQEKYPNWTFHLVGKDFNDDYSNEIKNKIIEKGLEETVFVYGSRDDVKNCINQASICILSSKSEGLPVALLEYGFNAKPVLVTNVGEMPLVIKNGINGFITDYNDENNYYKHLESLMLDRELRAKLGTELQKTIFDAFSEESIIKKYITFLQN